MNDYECRYFWTTTEDLDGQYEALKKIMKEKFPEREETVGKVVTFKAHDNGKA